MRIYLKEILAAFPEFRNSRSYVYKLPVKEMLVGYLVEFPPSGPRLRGLRFPLYERADFIHLDYSSELAKFRPDGTPRVLSEWALSGAARQPLSAEELRAILPRRMSAEAEREFGRRLVSYMRAERGQLNQREDLTAFVESLRPRAPGDPLFKKSLALTLVMLGELDEARALLIELRDESASFTEPQKDDLEQSLRTIEIGEQAAREYRLEVIERMREQFGIVD